MSQNLQDIHDRGGIQLATHVWGTTVSSVALVTASSGKKPVIRYIAVGASANGSVRITNGTSAATTYWIFTGAGPHSEECRIPTDDAAALTLHCTAAVGNGFIRVYYSIDNNSGYGS